jgi:hypothetical protein
MLPASPSHTTGRYLALLVSLTLLLTLLIEIRHPFYFLQDDNRTLYLPFYVHNLRALIGGEFPFFNFHQYLGTPVTIQYATLYPINYLALCLSMMVFGNYFAAMEILAAVHLVVAALGFFYLLRFFKLDEMSCLFGALTWAFCGFVITAGNSWIQIIGFAAYLPWILFLAIRQIYRFDISIFGVLALLKVFEFFLGYPQLFIYTATFEFLTIVLLYGADTGHDREIPERIGFRRPSLLKVVLAYFANYAVVFVVCLPLILQTAYQTAVSANRKELLSWEVYAAYSYKLLYWVHGLFVPFRPVDITTQFDLQFLSHVGYLTILFVVAASLPLKSLRLSHQNSFPWLGVTQKTVFWLLALFSLLWAGDILITKILYHVPVFNRLRFPFKLCLYSSFYFIIIAASGFDTCWRWFRWVTRTRRTLVVVVMVMIMSLHVANFMVLYVVLPQQMFSHHLDPLPLAEPLAGKLTDGRIVSASLDDVFDGEKIIPGYSAPLLGFDYATLWGLYQFGGYDPMVSEKAQKAALGIKNNPVFNLPSNEPFGVPSETLEYFRKWGVRWYIVNKAIPLRHSSGFTLIEKDTRRNVLEDPLAKPMVYWQGGSPDKPMYKFLTNSVEVDCTSTSGDTLIINVLHHPFFSARMDGQLLPITETADQQVSMHVPRGNHRILLKYTDAYFLYGAMVSAVFLLLLIPTLVLERSRTAIVKFFT